MHAALRSKSVLSRAFGLALFALAACSSLGHDAAPAPAANGSQVLALARGVVASDVRLTHALAQHGWRVRGDAEAVSPGWTDSGALPSHALGARVRGTALDVGIGPSEILRLTLEPVGAKPGAAEWSDGVAVWPGAATDVDTIATVEEGRIEILEVLRSARAPREFAWKVTLPPAIRDVVPDHDGLAWRDANGTTRFFTPPAYAIDANGSKWPVAIRFDAGQLVARLDAAAHVAYPVVLDPALESSIWLQRDVGVPRARGGPLMLYNPARQRTTLFGESDPNTWEWDGVSWSLRATDGPTVGSYGIAFDTVRSRAVLFGGFASGSVGATSITWEWDGTTWQQRATTGPSPRANAFMGFDSVRGRTVLFAGSSATSANDTWEWDGSTWQQVCLSGTCASGAPPYRVSARMTFDVARKQMLLFGGSTIAGYVNDLWAWDGTSWTKLCATGVCANKVPSARGEASLAYDSAHARTVMFGGNDATSTMLGDTWEWDGTAWTQRTPATTPGGRAGAALTFDARLGRVVLFGGANGFAYGGADTWHYDSSVPSWTNVSKYTAPPATAGRGMVYATATNTDVLLALGDTGVMQTWEWNGTAWKVDAPATSPTRRQYFSMTYDSVRKVAVLFGGEDASTGPKNDTWEWDGTNWAQKCSTAPCSNKPPTARQYPTLGFDAARGQTVLFGGRACATVCTDLNDTWVWNGSAWTQKTPTTSPPGRYGTAMAFDAKRNVLVMFSGSNNAADTWEWDGTNWTQRTLPTSPVTRSGHAMTWEAVQQKILLFGGPSADVWTYDGTTWTQDTSTPVATARTDHGLTFDLARKRTVAFGGTAVLGDTWERHTRGANCTLATDCETGFCVDGVCCEVASCGTCQACNGTTPGTCSAITNADDPGTCSGASTCDANGACKLKTGQGCSTPAQCASGNCADSFCCNTACSGSCDVCSAALGAPANGTCGGAPAGYAGSPACAPFACTGGSSCTTSCLSDNDCAANAYCDATGQCKTRKAKGASCNVQAGQDCLQGNCHACSSGFCVDGFCCESACDGACDVCSATPGSCTPVAAGTTGTPSCAPFTCSGTSASCATTCGTNAPCGTSAHCDTTTNKCVADGKIGEACGANGECQSGHCVDGVCCGGACDGQCEACDVTGAIGTCVPVAGAPHGARPACAAGTATDPCSAATCDGNVRTSCVQKVGSSVSCRAPSCTNGTATLAASCDGKGACPAAETKICEPYVCKGDGCGSTCNDDTECAPKFRCDTGSHECVGRTGGASCVDAHTSRAPDGTTKDCAPYGCAADGTCRQTCTSSSDCTGGMRCNAGGACVPDTADVAPPEASGCSCRAAGSARASESPFGSAALACAAFAGLVVRRKRRRASSLQNR